MNARELIEQCRAALAEEMAAYDIDPPIHHVKEAHDNCVAWLSSPAAEGAKVETNFCDASSRLCPCRRTGDTIGCEHAQPAEVLRDELESYDAGLFGDYGGGNVEWWHDYMRAELARAHDFYADQFDRAVERAVLAQPSGGDEREQMDAARDAALVNYFSVSGRAPMQRSHVYGDAYAQGWFDRAALAQQQGRDAFRPPLTGRWHHGNGVIVSGTLRIARDDFEAGIDEEVRDEIFDWICCTLNAAIAAARGE